MTSGPAAWGAAQLALLDRLEERGPVSGKLRERVLRTPAVGRGRVDIPVAGSAGDFGTPPMSEVPPGEVLRVAVGVLADMAQPPSAQPAFYEARLRAKRFRVHGPPLAAAAVRRTLREAGLAEGDFRATHLVIAGPVEDLVRDNWAARVRRGRARGWQGFWEQMRGVGHLPPGSHTEAMLGNLGRVPDRRLRVLVDPTPAGAARLAAGVFGVGAGALAGRTPAAVLALQRRLDAIRPPLEQRGIARTWLEDRAREVADAPLGAPLRHTGWVRDVDGRVAERLAAAGYPVLGDQRVEPLADGVPRSVGVAAVLDAAVVAIANGEESA